MIHLLPRVGEGVGIPFAPLRVPGSKSVCNRALVLAATADGSSVLEGGLEAEDTVAMRSCLQACGVGIAEVNDTWRVEGGRPCPPEEVLPVGASGTTLRFLLPWVALHLGGEVAFQGDPRLFERPLAPLLAALAPLGARWDAGAGRGRLRIQRLPGSRFETCLDPGLSSQFVTGLALAMAGLPEGGRIRWEGKAASTSYLTLTQEWLARFGCPSTLQAGCWEIPGNSLRPGHYAMPGDWSGAAAFLAAAAVTGREAILRPLDPEESQGDKAMMAILHRAGCELIFESGTVRMNGRLQRGLEADLTLCPDLGPVLAAVAALAPGPSVLTGLETLPLKECDRLEASADLVRWLGGQAEIEGDHTLRVVPGVPLGERPPFDPRNDHRMAFAAAVGALKWGGQLRNPGCVAKTFPTFWSDWARFLEG